MRIGVLTTSFPRHAQDIAGNFVLSSCTALIARGHTVEVLAPASHESASALNVMDLNVAGLHVTRIRYLPVGAWQRTFYGAGVPDNLRQDPRAWLGLLPFTGLLALHTARRAQHWDAMISHWALPCALLAALRPRRCRHVSVLHSADVHLLARLPAHKAVASAIVTNADHLWFTSRALAAKFSTCINTDEQRALREKHTCQPMAVEAPLPTDPRDALRTRLGVSGFVALVLGRLVAIKGIEHAIAAVAGTDVQLVIAGDGPERQRLQTLAAPLGNQVRFVGVVLGQSKSDWFTAADVLVVPSVVLDSGRTEGMPTTVIEAMSHGCPVVASDVGGIGELISHDHNGWLVPARDVAALREALQVLHTDSLRRVRIANEGTRSTQSLRWHHIAEAWETLLQPDGDVARG